jgi:hypothetical protein
MAGLNHLKDIYEKKGKEFLEALLNKEVIVNEKMDVHLNDAAGNILSKSSRIVSESIISPDKIRILYFEFEKDFLIRANSVGICIYDDVSNLYICKGNSLDWGGKRLVYTLK